MVNIHTLYILTGQFTEILFKGKKKKSKKPPQKTQNKTNKHCRSRI